MNRRLTRGTCEEVGVPVQTVTKVIKALKEFDSLNSVMMLRHGKVFFECWWKPFQADDLHSLFSVSKSFTSMAIGLAQSEGRLSLDDTLVSFFPEYECFVADEAMRKVTLKHLLTMTSGHQVCAAPQMFANMDRDWVKGFLSSQLTYEPGTHFAYNSAGTYMLSAVIRRVTGENVREYLIPRLFDPLMIDPGPWDCCPRGINMGGWGFHLRTEDMAKVGQMLLNGGQWGGMQIIPADYLAQATIKQSDNSMNGTPDWQAGYGYQFWKSVHGFRADGASGQFIVVLPKEDMVLVTTAGLGDMQRVLDIFWDELLPVLSDEHLPFDATGHKELDTLVDSLEIPVAQGDLSICKPPRTWSFRDNQAGIKELFVWFKGDHCLLDFVTDSGRENITAGFGFNCENYIKLNDRVERKTMVSAAWINQDVLELQLVCTESSIREVWRIDYRNARMPLSSTSRYCTFRSNFLPILEPADEHSED